MESSAKKDRDGRYPSVEYENDPPHHWNVSVDPGVPSGSTYHSGKIAGVSQDGTVKVLFEGKEWIEHPANYTMLKFLAVISPDRKTLVSDDYALDMKKTG